MENNEEVEPITAKDITLAISVGVVFAVSFAVGYAHTSLKNKLRENRYYKMDKKAREEQRRVNAIFEDIISTY